MSTTFFNVTIVWSTKSRASAIFLFKEKKIGDTTTKIWRKDNCLLHQPFRQIFVVVSPISFSFCKFLPSLKKNCLTIFTPELFNEHLSFQCNYRLLHQFASFSLFSYLRSFFFFNFSKDNCLLRQPFRQYLMVVSPIIFPSVNFCPVFSKLAEIRQLADYLHPWLLPLFFLQLADFEYIFNV